MYRISLETFEGPFDLLVYLIENAQMDIRDIQIAQITAQYIEYISEMNKLNITLAQEFIVMASTLLEIKSKMLLPKVETIAAEQEIEDPRRELAEKLLEYKKFKAASEYFAGREEAMQSVYAKPQEDFEKYKGRDDEYLKLDVDDFLSAFKQFLEKSKRVEEVRKHYTRLERARISVEMKMESIWNYFKAKLFKPVFFSELVKHRGSDLDKYDAVLTFSSVLQMLKDGKMDATQEYNFADIELSLKNTENEKLSIK